MPRAGQLKPVSDRRLSDLVSVGVIARTFPPGLVDEVVAGCGRTEQRARSLPARVMAYFSIGMALHADSSYEAALALMTDGLAWVEGTVPPVLPTSSAIFQARQRLGSEPVEALFGRVAVPLANEETPGSWLAGRRMVAIDGTCLDLADTVANDEFFGRPGVNKGERSAFPMARVVAVAECGTHAMFDAVIGPYSAGENTLAQGLVDRLEPGMVCLADRGFCGFPLWSRAVVTGADLLWRAKANMKPKLVEVLDDGSWLAEFKPSGNAGRKAAGLLVRVVEFSIDDGRSEDHEVYRLFTTLLDPEEVTATELALAYAQRWEIEIAFGELKTYQRGPKSVLRSKSPDLVLQEIWGYLCCHYAIRTLMWEAAGHHNVDPDRVSFLDTLRIVRRSISAARDLSPSR
ncbi:MAG: IS4 family transposase [Actinomycetia bacterium]|nr:IS4 family transposase [Actinomycetes bacterium]